MSATMPASGPYVAPNVELSRNIRSSPTVTIKSSTTDTAAPNANHDHAGCRRLGAWRNSTAVPIPSSTSASGQRTIDHTVATPGLPIDWPMSRPSARATTATTNTAGAQSERPPGREVLVLGDDPVHAEIDRRDRAVGSWPTMM